MNNIKENYLNLSGTKSHLYFQNSLKTKQVNLHYGDKHISAYGLIKEKPTLIIASNFPNLLKKIKKHFIKMKDLILTFQPED